MNWILILTFFVYQPVGQERTYYQIEGTKFYNDIPFENSADCLKFGTNLAEVLIGQTAPDNPYQGGVKISCMTEDKVPEWAK